jgi:SAM-dependent methyltransferase
VSSDTDKWSAPGSGERYAGQRFASGRAAMRDPKLVRALLERHGVRGAILDVPCGSGRLHQTLAAFGQRVVGADISADMLRASSAPRDAWRACASIACLPFRDGAFDVVVSCRYLHHVRVEADLAVALCELVRVSRRLLIGSYWDAASLPALRTRLGWKRAEGRRAIRRELLEQLIASAGARVIDSKHSLRFVSQQAFFVAERA